ncbi:MAG: tetratricopeptide repeat protein [Promethearchaeota archaeon]
MNNSIELKPHEKLKKLEETLKVVKNSDDISGVFNTLLNLAELCYEIKANELGLKYSQEAIELDKKDPVYKNIHEFYKFLGDFNFELGYLDQALDAYTISIGKTPKKTSFKILSEMNFKMGRINYLQDDLKKAIKHFKKAEKICEEAGLYAEQARIYNQIGLMYINKIPEPEGYGIDKYTTVDIRGTSSFNKAKKYFKKAKLILEKNNLTEIENTLYNAIQANLTSKWKDYKSLF